MYLTYETVFDLDRMPASMIVIGAGATGVEIAQALARLGCKITLIDQRPSVLTEADPDAAAIIHRSLQSDGIDVQLSAVVNGVTPSGAQVVVATSTSRLTADAFLLATGRRPRIGALDLERAHIDLHDGSIRVDKHLRTTNPHVYAAGDVTGGFQFTHYAGWQGYVAARNALLPGTQEGLRQNIPWVVFTDPEVAQAGLSEVEARAQFSDVKVHRLELERVDRAQTADEREGFLKLITGAGGKLVGASVVSMVAGETINELALAVDRGLTLSDLASTIHAYPTFGFAVQQLAAEATFEAAASGIRGQAIRALRRLTGPE
jgi:pyruvate/2-oxoglutarate dehydrogenase complex dihydrolipoamide dehydrogenase (E3) component